MEMTPEAMQLSLVPSQPEEPRDVVIPLVYLPGDEELGPPRPNKRFVESIRHFGVITPIILQELPEDGYRVIDGRRRIQAARQVGLQEVPCRLYAGIVSEVGLLLLNEQRSRNPIAELQAIEALFAQGVGEQEIQEAIGISPQKLHRLLAMHHLIPELREAFDRGRMALGVAEQAAKLPPQVQRKIVTSTPGTRIHLSDVQQVRHARVMEATTALPEALFPPVSMDNWPRLAQRLSELLGEAFTLIQAAPEHIRDTLTDLFQQVRIILHTDNGKENGRCIPGKPSQ